MENASTTRSSGAQTSNSQRWPSAAEISQMSWRAKEQLRRRINADTPDADPREWSPARVAQAVIDYEAGHDDKHTLAGWKEHLRRSNRDDSGPQRVELDHVVVPGLIGIRASALIEKAPVIAHIKWLRAAGVSRMEIIRASGVGADTYTKILHSKGRRIQCGNARAICSVVLANSAQPVRVPEAKAS